MTPGSRLRNYVAAWRSTVHALRQLRPILRAGRGGLLFSLATIGWLGQTFAEWGVALLLLVFLAALGLIPAEALPAWLPPEMAELGTLAIWGVLLGFAALQSTCQIVSLQSRALFVHGIEARLKMILAHSALMRVGARPDLSRMNYLTGDVFPRTTNFFYHASLIVSSVLQAGALIGAMLYVEPLSAGIALVGIGLFGALVLWFNRLNNRASASLPPAQAAFEQSKVRLARNWLYIRALRLEPEEYAKQMETSARIYRYNLRSFLFANLGGTIGPVFGVVLIASILVGHASVGGAPAASLLPFFYLLFRFQQIVASASHLVGGLFTFRVHLLEAGRFVAESSPEECAAALRVMPAFRISTRTPGVSAVLGEAADDRPDDAPRASQPPALTVKALGFRWSEASEPLLSGLTFDLPAGEHLAVVGPNGAGKSTLLALLLGAVRPSEGEIQLDNSDSEAWVSRNRTLTAFVGAEPYLVAGSVRDNLVCGLHREVADADLKQALDAVGLADRETARTVSLDHRISEGAAGLSAGEQQKLAFARALLRRPKLLILDEPTAHVDRESESDIGEALRQLGDTCTVVIVSHKPGVLTYADRVLTLGVNTSRFEVLPTPAISL